VLTLLRLGLWLYALWCNQVRNRYRFKPNAEINGFFVQLEKKEELFDIYLDPNLPKCSTTKTRLKMYLDRPHFFQLTKGTGPKNFLFRWGIHRIFLTQDKDFDQLIEIQANSPDLPHLLQQNQELRRLMLTCFTECGLSIRLENQILSFEFMGPLNKNSVFLSWCIDVYLALQSLPEEKSIDPFLVKAISIEIGSWFLLSLCTYWILRHNSAESLSNHSFIWRGLLTGFFLALGWRVMLSHLLGGYKQRSRYMILESFLLAGLSTPMISILLLLFLNESWDKKPSLLVEGVIKEIKPENTTSEPPLYHVSIELNHTPPLENLSSTAQITTSNPFIQIGDKVFFDVKQGRLKHPWYQNYRFERNQAPETVQISNDKDN
jgi:hypothetical protein